MCCYISHLFEKYFELTNEFYDLFVFITNQNGDSSTTSQVLLS